jgi:Spy/CpxP family protein refolding chaperone
MKKNIIAIVVLVTLTIGNSFAQGGYVKHHTTVIQSNPRHDSRVEENQIKHLDRIVDLTNKQENQIQKIENKYDRLARNQRSIKNLKTLDTNKQKEILAVLNPYQRKKLMAYQKSYGSHDKRFYRG